MLVEDKGGGGVFLGPDLMITTGNGSSKLLRHNILYITVCAMVALTSCSHGKVKVEEPSVQRPKLSKAPSRTTLKQTIERLEVILSQREDQLSTLRQRLERVSGQRDAYAAELEQVNEELDKLREENAVLNKKIEEILAPKPASPPAKPDIYVVQPGDTLESIAGKEDIYGDRSRWEELYEENKDVIGSAPDNLVPGTKLIIPRP